MLRLYLSDTNQLVQVGIFLLSLICHDYLDIYIGDQGREFMNKMQGKA